MRIGINKDAARHVDAYVNEHNRVKMEKLIQEKGLQGKKGPIGFMDLLPKEETYGYQIEQESRNRQKQLGYEVEDDALEGMNEQIGRDNRIAKYKFGETSVSKTFEPATESITAYELFTTPHNFMKIQKPSIGMSSGAGRAAIQSKPVGGGASHHTGYGMKSTAPVAAARKKL